MTAMGRKPLTEPRNRRLATYLTAGEETAALKLAETYHGVANVLRRGLALLIEIKHPELMKNLRKDLDTAL